MAEAKKSGYGYGKRPLWQWILIYVVIGGLVYAAVYYFFFANNGGYNYGTSTQGTEQDNMQYNYGN